MKYVDYYQVNGEVIAIRENLARRFANWAISAAATGQMQLRVSMHAGSTKEVKVKQLPHSYVLDWNNEFAKILEINHSSPLIEESSH
jgi:hypothetical protein